MDGDRWFEHADSSVDRTHYVMTALVSSPYEHDVLKVNSLLSPVLPGIITGFSAGVTEKGNYATTLNPLVSTAVYVSSLLGCYHVFLVGRWFKYITEAADSQKKSSTAGTIKRGPPVYKTKLTLSEEEAASQSSSDLKAENDDPPKLTTNKYVTSSSYHLDHLTFTHLYTCVTYNPFPYTPLLTD